MAKRMAGKTGSGSRLSKLMARIAVVSVMLSMAVMIIAIAVTAGFQNEVRKKAVDLTGHIILSNYDSNISFEATPVAIAQANIPELLKIKGVLIVRPSATKGGIIKTADEVQGAVLKGFDADVGLSAFADYLVEGELPTFSDSAITNKALMPVSLAKRLFLKVGDSFDMYFIQDPPRVRNFVVSGLYNAPFDNVSDALILADIKHIRRLNGWTNEQVGAVEIFINDMANLTRIAEQIDDLMAYTITDEGRRLKVETVADLYMQLFDWLNLLDMNVVVILVLMLLVAGFNMISGLLILVFEKTAMIGLIKAMGMRNVGVQRIFLYRAAFIVLKGMLWGNIIALSFCLLQYYFHLVPLDPANYYMSYVPIMLRAWPLIAVNVFGFIGITLLLALPVLVIARISPDKTIKSE
ncbi:MAG: ABC transporter permease [Bacteroidales bacterium]|nr:ABC transporter permease [Bacteroidales bacterium]MCL2133655.1 ABC transporter permease [Bacteroidales bacterium]